MNFRHHHIYRWTGTLCVWGSLLGLMLLGASVSASSQPPTFASVLAGMRTTLAATTDYRCRLHTWSSNGDESRAVVLTYFYRHEAKIRMEVLEGPYRESLLIYNREIDPDRVRVIAGNRFVAFLQRMLYGEFFAVDHEWVVDLRGNGIHESDWAHFISEHERYLNMGTSQFVREERLNGRKAYLFKLISHQPEKSMRIKQEDVWVDAEWFFPMKYLQYDSKGDLIRETVVTDLAFNTGIDERLFIEFHPEIE